MTRSQLISNAKEMVQNSLLPTLENEIYRLSISGGVDLKSYESDDMGIVKAFLSAALENCVDQFTPLDKKLRAEKNNLLNF